MSSKGLSRAFGNRRAHWIMAVVVFLVLSGCSSPPDSEADADPSPDVSPASEEPTESPPSPAPSSGTGTGNETDRSENTTASQDNRTDLRNGTDEPGSRDWIQDPWTLDRDGWASREEARIYPGVQVASYMGYCTVNFVFTDPNGTTVYVGTASHCMAPKGTEGADIDDAYCDGLPEVEGEDQFLAFFGPDLDWKEDDDGEDGTGRYVYGSFLEMKADGETDEEVCFANDFALIEVDPEYRHLVNPTAEHWAGPNGLSYYIPELGEKVYTVGGTNPRTCLNTQQMLGLCPLYEEVIRPREGYASITASYLPRYENGNPWEFESYFAGGCIGGDSGSPVFDKDGNALGVLNSMNVLLGDACRAAYMSPALDYMMEHTDLEVVLQTGVDPFIGGILPEMP